MYLDQLIRSRDDEDQPDDFDADDFDNDDDFGDDGMPDTSTDVGKIEGIRQLLAAKFHLNLPPDTSPRLFLRDLLCALHGHPGIELVNGGEGEGESDDGGLSQQGYRGPGKGQLPSNRKPAGRRMSSQRPATEITPAGQRMTPERAARVLGEALHNGDLSECEHQQVSRARLSRGRGQRITPTRSAECVAEICRNAGLD